MKKITATLISYIKIFRNISLSTLVLITVIFIFGQMAQAQNDPGIDVKQYLMAKYNIREDDVISIMQQTPDGLRGYLSIKGEIKSQNILIAESAQDRARAVAKAFLKEESSLFGITNVDEIQEIVIYSGEGSDGAYTNINYLRYIENWELRGAYINIKIGPDEKIISAEAYLVPAPPELYRAVAGKTLAEAEIRKIIEDDMKTNAESPDTTPTVKAMIADFDPKLMSLRKFLIPKPPYVIYEVHTVWGYTINALTGEILERVPVGYIRLDNGAADYPPLEAPKPVFGGPVNAKLPDPPTGPPDKTIRGIKDIHVNIPSPTAGIKNEVIQIDTTKRQGASSQDAAMPMGTISASPKESAGMKKETEKISSPARKLGKGQLNPVEKPLTERSLKKNQKTDIPSWTISKQPEK